MKPRLETVTILCILALAGSIYSIQPVKAYYERSQICTDYIPFTHLVCTDLYYCYYLYGYYYESGYPKLYQVYIKTNPPALESYVYGAGFYCILAPAEIGVNTRIINSSDETRYVFTGWSGAYNGNESNPVFKPEVGPYGYVPQRAYEVTANFRPEYQVKVQSQPSGLLPEKTEWVSRDAFFQLPETRQIIEAGEGKRYMFQGWISNGQPVGGLQQIMTSQTFQAVYKTQYYLQLHSGMGQTAGEGWYDAGSQAAVSIKPTSIAGDYWMTYRFERWSGDLQDSSPQTTVLMDGQKRIDAVWTPDYSSITNWLIIAGIIGILSASAIILRRRII